MEMHIIFMTLDSCKNQHYCRSQTRNNNGNDRGRSKLRKKSMEYHYCHRKGQLNKDCYAPKNKEKDNAKFKGDGHKRQFSGSFSLVEVKATCDDMDILVLDYVSTHVWVNMIFFLSHTWLLDFGASLHVTPHREWFTCYKA